MTKSSVLLAHAWLCTLLTLSLSGRAASDEVERYLGESTTMPTLLSITGTDYTSPSTFDAFSRNQYAYAREDAAAYTASDGQIHGVQLERAWHDPRHTSSPRAEPGCLCRRNTGVECGMSLSIPDY